MQISGLCCTTEICKSVDCAVPRRYANQWIVLYHGDMQISGLCCTTEICKSVDCAVPRRYANQWIVLYHAVCKSVDCAVPRGMQISGLCCTTEIVTLCSVCVHVAHHDDLLLHSLPQSEGRKELFYLTTHSTHFIYGYMASNKW